MSTNLKVFSIMVGIAFLALIIELVRRQRLREDYSVIYLATGAVILLLVIKIDLLFKITDLLGAIVPASILFLFAILFLLLMSLQYAVKVSKLSNEVKNLAQKTALMDAEIRALREGAGKGD